MRLFSYLKEFLTSTYDTQYAHVLLHMHIQYFDYGWFCVDSRRSLILRWYVETPRRGVEEKNFHLIFKQLFFLLCIMHKFFQLLIFFPVGQFKCRWFMSNVVGRWIKYFFLKTIKSYEKQNQHDLLRLNEWKLMMMVKWNWNQHRAPVVSIFCFFI